MAVDAATLTRYEQKAVREDLTNKIYNLAPMDTPVMTAIGRGKAPKNTKYEWQTDDLAAPGVNAKLEGDDATFLTATATTRLSNYTQIFTKSVSVSDTQAALDIAGQRDALLYQVEKRTKEVKREIEFAICGNYASDDGSRGTARRLGGLESWFTSNVGRGTGGSSGGYSTGTSQTAAATDSSSTNQRTFTETRAKAVIKSIWDNSGGSSPMIVVGSWVKQVASAFGGIASRNQQYAMGPTGSEKLAIIGAADIYVSDYGKHRIVPNRFSRSRTALFLDPEYLSVHYLRPFNIKKLAATGDAEKRMLRTELTLCVKNEKALGVCADLKTS